MESDYSTLCNELDNIFLECPTDKSGCADVQSLIDAFVNKYGNEKPQLRSIISDKLDPQGYNPSISRSCFKRLILEWIVSYNHAEPIVYTESSTNIDRDVFEYEASSYAHSTPLGRFNQRVRKIPQKKLSYSPAFGFTSDSLENPVSPPYEESKSYRNVSKVHNSSLENSLVKAEQKIYALEEELRTLKLHSRKDTERLKEEINQLKHFEKLYAGSVNKIEKYAETLNNLTKEYNRLKVSKEDLFKEYTNLEIDHQRLRNEIDAKNISLKALETWKRVQIEELVVLNDSKSMLECEVFKLKNDVKSRTENEESLLLRIGELQSEKQKLQTELNEVSFEKIKMAASSPSGKSFTHEDQYSERDEDNRESGISVRSELIDSLGFSSCINETFNLPFLSVINRTSGDFLPCGVTATDLLSESFRSQKVEQEVQTEEIEEKRTMRIEKEVQTELICEERIPKLETEMLKEEINASRLCKIEKGIQTDSIEEESSKKNQKELQSIENREKRITKVEKDTQTEVIYESRMDIDTSLEDLHNSFCCFANYGKSIIDGCELTFNDSVRQTGFSALNVENDSICSSSSDRSMTAYEFIPIHKKKTMSTPRVRIKRIEAERRLSCLDVYDKSVSICRSNTYQKLTFSRKISTIFAGIISILSPGVRTCAKTILWLFTFSLVFFMIVIVMLIKTWKHDWTSQQYFWPYIVLKYPKGPPPT